MTPLALVTLLALLLAPGRATAASPVRDVRADVVVTRLTQDRWRVDYTFDTPVSGVVYGPPAAAYRERAWRLLSPDVALVEDAGRERVVSTAQDFSTLHLEVERFTDYAPDHYAPLIPFSDGGAALYLGFFACDAVVDGTERPVAYRFRFEGLPEERVIAPGDLERNHEAYVYFGTQEPVVLGHARLLLDPDAPAWLQTTFHRVTQATTGLFSERLGVRPPERPLVLIGAGELSAYDGYSVKGGAVGDQLVMSLRGRGLAAESDEVRAAFERLTAHELSHLWQLDMLPAGFSVEEPWLHEGSAEAMAVYALGEAGIWSRTAVEGFAEAAAGQCREALGDATLPQATRQGNWAAVYACGFGLFQAAEADPVSIWSALMDRMHRDEAGFTQETLDRVLATL